MSSSCLPLCVSPRSTQETVSLSLDESEHELRYKPVDTSDILLIINLCVSRAQVEYRVHAHKAVLAAQCDYFAGVFSVDTNVKEITLPHGFTCRNLNGCSVGQATHKGLLLFFDTLYNIENRCWWALNTKQRRDIVQNGAGTFAEMVFYSGFKTLFKALETHFIHDHLEPNKMYNISMLVQAREYKMIGLEKYVVDELVKQARKDPKHLYSEFIATNANWIPLVPIEHLHTLLKAVCESKQK